MKLFTEIPQNSIGDTLNNILHGEKVSLPALLELVDVSCLDF